MYCRGTYIQVDLSAIRHNAQELKHKIGPTRMLAIVKANAYGHGLLQVARAATENGADMLGVAIPEEGITLREGGIKAPILVLGGVNVLGAAASARYHLIQTVFDANGVEQLQAQCEALDTSCEVHVKLDTGMGRIGVRNQEELAHVLEAIKRCPLVHLNGAFTHFSDADGESEDYSRMQMKRFDELCRLMPKNILHHVSASAGILRFPDARYDMVRAGIALYGYAPVKTELDLRPALSFYSEVVFVKDIREGDQISYGRTFTAPRDMRIATLAVGYGDGYHRAAGEKAYVLLQGKRCKVLGRICMDQMLVDVTGLNVKKGDRAVLLGRQGEEKIDAEELASWAGTICWEVLLSATARVPIEYAGL